MVFRVDVALCFVSEIFEADGASAEPDRRGYSMPNHVRFGGLHEWFKGGKKRASG
jgi:hypothetical protein